jgi:hypothetical protein
MALTRTRTRTQTTLTKLATALAHLKGEIEYCNGLLGAGDLADNVRAVLRAHLSALNHKQEAIRLTLMQFDAELDLDAIRAEPRWQLRLGTMNISQRILLQRMLKDVTPVA